MRLRAITLLSFLLIGLFLADPAMGQRNPYKKRRGGGKSVSKYKGSARGGIFRPYEYVGFGLNAMNYYGDLAPLAKAASTDVSFTRPGFGFTYGIRFHPQASMRVNYNFGRIKGDDISSQAESRYARNLSFRNNINELNVGFNLYFFEDRGSSSFRNPINAYLFVGGGFFFHDPQGRVPEYDYQLYGPSAAEEGAPGLEQAGEWVKLRTLRTEGQGGDFEGAQDPYKPFQWQIPINLGAMFAIPRTPFNVHIEFGYRFIFTDYLDDVSTNYVSLDRFDNDLARIMSDRGVEPTNGFGNVTRELPRIVQQPFEDGSSYFIAGDVGSGIQGSIRGNPLDADMYFVTQVKLTYIPPPNGILEALGIKKRRGNAKFR
jgi:hypothetical protein